LVLLSRHGGEEQIDDAVPLAGEQHDQDDGQHCQSCDEQRGPVVFFDEKEDGVHQQDADGGKNDGWMNQKQIQDEEGDEQDAAELFDLRKPDEKQQEHVSFGYLFEHLIFHINFFLLDADY